MTTAPALWRCENCSRSSRRTYRYPVSPDLYCDTCGAPMPAAERVATFLGALTNRLDALLHAERSPSTAPDSPAISVEDAAKRLGCERTQIFHLLRSGRLRRAEKAGRKTLVLTSSVGAFFDVPAPAPARRRPLSARGTAQEGRALAAQIARVPIG